MKIVSAHKLFKVILLLITASQTHAQKIWTLSECLDTAVKYNTMLQISGNSIELSNEKLQEAKGNLLPKINTTIEYKYYTDLPHQLMPLSTFNPTAQEGQFKDAQFGVPHNISTGIQLVVPIYNPLLYGAIQSAKTAKELSNLQYKKTEEELFFEITTLYYNAQILSHQLNFIDKNIYNNQQLLSTMELLRNQKMAITTDVNKVHLQAAQLKTQKAVLENTQLKVLNVLKLTMGVSVDTEILIDAEIKPEGMSTYFTSNVTDISILQTQHKLLSTDIHTLIKSKYRPSLNLVFWYGTNGFGYDKKPNDFLKFYPVGFTGVQLTYPLFNGTITNRKISQKRLELRNNELQTDFLTEQNRIRTINALNQREVAQHNVEMTDEQINLAKSIYDQTILQQKLGTASITDVLLADNALQEAQQRYLDAIINYLKADLELKKLTGNLTIKN